MHGAGGAVALLGDDDLRLAFGVGIFLAVLVLVVVAVAMNEGNDVGILLYGSGFAQIGAHRLLVGAAARGPRRGHGCRRGGSEARSALPRAGPVLRIPRDSVFPAPAWAAGGR